MNLVLLLFIVILFEIKSRNNQIVMLIIPAFIGLMFPVSLQVAGVKFTHFFFKEELFAVEGGRQIVYP